MGAQAVESKANYSKFVAESNARIANFNAEVAKWEAMKPIEEMNLEEALDAGLTQFVIDPAAQTPWPHEESWDQYKESLQGRPQRVPLSNLLYYPPLLPRPTP